MKPCGCEFCNDLRNIQPASYIDGGDETFKEWIEEARKQKKFILDLGDQFAVIDSCPKCDYKFTEEDYDSYCI